MDFETWKKRVAADLGTALGCDGAKYIEQTGDECWREMFDDGLTPYEAAHEEYVAACESQ